MTKLAPKSALKNTSLSANMQIMLKYKICILNGFY